MNPLAYLRVAEIVAGLALIAGICWGVHEFLEHERDIGRAEVQARWDKQTAADKLAAAAETTRLEKQKSEAEKNGANREQTIRTLTGAVGNANVGLHDALATVRSGVPSATIEALGKSVATLSTVLADCSGRYQSVAASADRHASDVRTLIDAWPENKVVPAK